MSLLALPCPLVKNFLLSYYDLKLWVFVMTKAVIKLCSFNTIRVIEKPSDKETIHCKELV